MLKLLISGRDDLEDVTGEKIRRREFVIVFEAENKYDLFMFVILLEFICQFQNDKIGLF